MEDQIELIQCNRRRITLSPSVRFAVFQRDNFTCQYCGRTPPSVSLECDHVIPVAKGGRDKTDNLVTSCHDCNRGKRDLSIDPPLWVKESLQKKITKTPVKHLRKKELDIALIFAPFVKTLWDEGKITPMGKTEGKIKALAIEYKHEIYRYWRLNIHNEQSETSISSKILRCFGLTTKRTCPIRIEGKLYWQYITSNRFCLGRCRKQLAPIVESILESFDRETEKLFEDCEKEELI